ncbi:polysaccharide pyruvyl transferase family protein [Marinobacter qingdaonensis]|uniref:Polysaccharide pyruvyl transferase family protein n=1 Tax=Marinobacter qingdaonensis TaxID=3108486 RepID=A0ABU5P0J1_9GAMM|nr:polysaccharide pyruvyl transferase family protein [Marinobacter sp. ASW11-75]MEA1081452.1 polysaccharide pyruvyl transferase family protein [Marinobacter sp. ASW11-75]
MADIMNPVTPDNSDSFDLLLTTFPKNGTRNVGDHLITESALKLVRHRVPNYRPVIVFREEPLEQFDKSSVRTILAPGFTVSDETYPNKFKLYENLEGVLEKIFPVGCSFQHWIPSYKTYEEYCYSNETLSLLKSLSKNDGAIPCRDELIVKMLDNWGISSSYIGDLALYDPDVIGKKFTRSKKIESVAFSIQHKPKFFKQSMSILSLTKKAFPDAQLYVVHHSTPSKNSIEVAEYAKSIGYIEKDLSGEIEKLDFYDDVDLHVGYRLHGHISFLRRRKPSVLIVEDARSFGISKTGPLSLGAFSAVDDDGTTWSRAVARQVFDFLRSQSYDGFKDYRDVFKYIDDCYWDLVRPYFDRFSAKLGWSQSRLGLVKEKFFRRVFL